MTNFWVGNTLRYDQQEPGIAVETIRGGFLTIQSTSSGEEISLPFIWGTSIRGSRPGWGIDPDENFDNLFSQQPSQAYWWQFRPLSSSEDGNGNDGFNLISTNYGEGDSHNEFLLSIGYNQQIDSFIKTRTSITVSSSNPVTDDNIFSRLFSRSYRAAKVTEVPLPIAGENPAPAVPEPSSNLAAVVVGAIALGLAVKRKLSHTSTVSGRRE